LPWIDKEVHHGYSFELFDVLIFDDKADRENVPWKNANGKAQMEVQSASL
jgi:hypothetical protein